MHLIIDMWSGWSKGKRTNLISRRFLDFTIKGFGCQGLKHLNTRAVSLYTINTLSTIGCNNLFLVIYIFPVFQRVETVMG